MRTRRLRVLSLLALCSFLIGCDASELDAQEMEALCPSPCIKFIDGVVAAQARAVQTTLARQWYAGVFRQMPEAECIRHRESRGDYHAENAVSTASGAYQFLRSTGDAVNAAMGRHDLVGLPASAWAPWDQDLAWAYLFERAGWAPWGGGCG